MISIIICSVENERFESVHREYDRVLKGIPYEIIRISDATGISEGYTRGLSHAKYDQLIFSHDDIEILADDFYAKVTSRLGKHDLIGIAGASRIGGPRWLDAGPPYIFGQATHVIADGSYYVDMYNNTNRVFPGMKIIDGVLMATHKRVLEKCPFDAVSFNGFHFYDMDFSLRVHLAGMSVAVCTDLGIIHHSRGNYDTNWIADANYFLTKYSAHVSPVISSKYKWAGGWVANREGIRNLINPDFWPPFVP